MKPETVYRYKGLNESGKALLLNQELYYCSYKQLNDPAEGNIELRYDLLQEDQLRAIITQVANRGMPYVDAETRSRMVNDKLMEFLANDRQELKRMSPLLHKQVSEFVGIVSLSTSSDNNLLWAHYADGHKGFCIGFNSEKLIRVSQATISGAVSYSNELSQEELLPGYDEDLFVRNMIATSFVKDMSWAYEKEFRLFKDPCYEGKRAFYFPADIVTSVSFGCRMPDGEKELLIQHCRKLYPNAKLLQAYLPPNAMLVKFNEIGE